MGKYLFAYRGGSMPENEAEREAGMAAWGAWFGTLGSSVSDPGNPFAASMSVASDGSTAEAAGSGLSGYSVVTADSLAGATELAKDCPILTNGGGVDVYEAHEMM